jgi:hypothetical protein
LFSVLIVSYKKNPKKVWVMEQYEARVRSLSWNACLAIPIVPSVHGTDFLVAEKIAETGFAMLSSLDSGYFGKVFLLIATSSSSYS